MDGRSEPDPDKPRSPDEAERLERRKASREKYNAKDPERARRQHVESQRRSRERQRAEEARRKQARERARAWNAANPERARVNKEAWKQQNPEKVREIKRNYYARNREQRQRAAREQSARRRQDPAVREQELHYLATHREQTNAYKRARRADPAIRARDNERQNERRRIDRRLRKLGLTPRPLRRTSINERAANAAASEKFFTRRRGPGQVLALRQELAAIQSEAARNSDERWRADLQARIRADAARPARIRALLDEYLATPAGAVLREEVRMDSIARRVRGADPYPSVQGELRRRAAAALMARRAALPTAGSLARRVLADDPSAGRSIAS